VCEDCRVQNQERKIAQFLEPKAIHRGTRKKSDKTATKKVLMDRLTAARIDLVNAVERRVVHGKESWWSWGYEWSEKKYQKALQDCWDAGINIKS
jgi:hypothetical protein